MKKIFKKLFSKNRVDLINENLSIKNPVVLEIGIHRGDFSKELIKNLNPKKIILVDPWIAYEDIVYKNSWYGISNKSNQKIQDQYYFELLNFFKKDILDNKVEIFRMTSDDFFSTNNYKFDLIYIDGNHLFEYVKNDILNSLKFVNKKGIIVLDDYALKGWWNDDITRAVEFHVNEGNIKILKKHNLFSYHHQCIIKSLHNN